MPETVHSTGSQEDDNKAEKASIMKQAKAEAEAEEEDDDDSAAKNMHQHKSQADIDAVTDVDEHQGNEKKDEEGSVDGYLKFSNQTTNLADK